MRALSFFFYRRNTKKCDFRGRIMGIFFLSFLRIKKIKTYCMLSCEVIYLYSLLQDSDLQKKILKKVIDSDD